MASASQYMLNQTLFEEQFLEYITMLPSQIAVDFSFCSNLASLPFVCSQTVPFMKTLAPIPPSLAPPDSSPTDISDHCSIVKEQKEDFVPKFPQVVPQLVSLQRASLNYRAPGELSDYCMGMKRSSREDHCISVATMKMKKIKGQRRVREPRFCFKTMSHVDVLDDGYKWRKYGSKVVKNSQHARSYYRCTQDKCRVKKRVERLADDPRMVITTYEGRHIHSPSRDEDDNDDDSPSSSAQRLNNFFW